MRNARREPQKWGSAFPGGILFPCVFVVLAMSAAPETSARAAPITSSKGKVRAAYEALMRAHCDLKRVSVATPLEARILRNVPYAVAGRYFKAPELRVLFANDGAWYRPRRAGARPGPTLSKADAGCVVRLKRLERKLRRKLPIPRAIERILTRHPLVFLTLRKGGGGARYGGARGHIVETPKTRRWTWRFADYGACGGDGSRDQRGDCAGFSVTCELAKGVKDLRKLDCTASWAG